MSILKTIKKLILRVVKVAYFDGEMHRIVCGRGTNVTFEKVQRDFTPALLVLSRKYYDETAHNYPVTNRRELTKALQLKKINFSQFIVNTTKDKSKVLGWKFATDVCERASVVIPESYLLSHLISDGILVLQNEDDNSESFISRTRGRVASAQATALLNSEEAYSIAIGLHSSLEVVKVKRKSLPETIINALIKFPIRDYKSFFAPMFLKRKRAEIKKLIFGLGITYILFLVFTTGYLFVKESMLKAQLSELSVSVEDNFDKQRELEQYRKMAQSYLLATDNWINTEEVWLVVHELFDSAQVENVSFINNRFIIRGKTKDGVSATSILSELTYDERVTDALFNTPVSKSGSVERFVISFRLKGVSDGA